MTPEGAGGGDAARPVRAVIFDWGGTLTPWHTVDFSEQWRVYARHVHGDTPEAEELAQRLLAVERRAWARVRDGGGSSRMAEVLADAGLDAEHVGLAEARAAYEEFWEPHSWTDPDVVPLFTALSRGLSAQQARATRARLYPQRRDT